MNGLRLQIGYLNCEAFFSDGQAGGLALLSRDGLDVRFHSKSNHHISMLRFDPVMAPIFSCGSQDSMVIQLRRRGIELVRYCPNYARGVFSSLGGGR